jgi:hypothetical protein
MTEQTEGYRSNIRRPISLHIRLSKDEYTLMSDAANDANLPLTDWLRRTVIGVLKAQKGDPMFVTALEEIEFIKLFLVNAIPFPMTGKVTTDEQIKVLIRKCSEGRIIATKQLIESTNRKDKN